MAVPGNLRGRADSGRAPQLSLQGIGRPEAQQKSAGAIPDAGGRTGQGNQGLTSMNAVADPVSPLATPQRQRSKPLLPVRGVVSIIDKNEDQVLALIEEGKLAWAWDVALDTKRGRRRALRILPAAVADYLRGQTCSLDLADVLRLLLPHDEPVILSRDITHALNISSTHLYALARRKQMVPCSTWRTGPSGCARFPAKNFIGFLKARRVL